MCIQVNLSSNQLCGLDWMCKGTYTRVAIDAIASALLASPSLNSLDLGYNGIDQATALELLATLEQKEMVSIGLGSCALGIEGAHALAEMAASSRHLHTIDVRNNLLGVEGGKVIADAMRNSSCLTSLDLRENNLANFGRDMAGIRAIGDAMSTNPRLTSME